MNRIIFESEERSADGHVRFGGSRARHVFSVLRAAPGDTVRMGELGGERFDSAVLVDVSAQSCAARLGPPSPPLSRNPADLLLALPRPKCLRRLLPQIAALGPARVFVTAAEKVEKAYWGATALEPGECRERLMDGLCQSGDTILPEIRIVRRLKPFVQDEIPSLYPDPRSRLIAHPEKSTRLLPRHDWRSSAAATGRPLLIAVGPEGGWSEFEIGLFGDAGFSRISLGERTLRTDTAVVALLSLAAEGRLTA